jgi:hypothetical protein
MTTKLNVLILHRLGDPRTWRESMVEKELCLPKFATGHNYLVHDFWLPLPNYVKDIAFDAIVLTQTFLGARQDPGMRARLDLVYGDLLRDSSYKIALPQDDYTCSGILDRFMSEWNVGVVYPVCANDWESLYPRYSNIGILKQGFTGYVSDGLIERTNFRKPIGERSTDVAYRAALHSTGLMGRMGQVKNEFGERFADASSGLTLCMDISTRPRDTILGTHWYDFIENTRCMLGVNSGSSLLDPEGLINERVFRYLGRYPKASFEEVEASCFPGQDGQHEFTAISPRNLECALFGTAQILAPGPYSGFFNPWEHYIPLEPDMSNFADVAPLFQDHAYLQAMATRCRDAILSYPQLRYGHHVAELIDEIQSHTRVTDAERASSVPLIERHQHEMTELAPDFWRRQRLVTTVRQTLGNLGLRRLKYWLKDRIDQQTVKVQF